MRLCSGDPAEKISYLKVISVEFLNKHNEWIIGYEIILLNENNMIGFTKFSFSEDQTMIIIDGLSIFVTAAEVSALGVNANSLHRAAFVVIHLQHFHDLRRKPWMAIRTSVYKMICFEVLFVFFLH